MKLIKKLASYPQEIVQSNNDREVKELVIALGLADKFVLNPRGPKRTLQTAILNDHQTHYIFVARHLGYENPRDNGYLAFCLPKSKVSAGEFTEFVSSFLKPAAGQVLGIEGISTRPRNSN